MATALSLLPRLGRALHRASPGAPSLRLPHQRHLAATAAAAHRPPVPPFTEETARQKVQAAQDAWNSQDAEKVSLAYSPDTEWRNRDTFLKGRESVVKFLSGKWEREQDYVLKKHYFAHSGNRIAVTFQYEFRDRDTGNWVRAYGNEHWTFDDDGYMEVRNASINDVQIDEAERTVGTPAEDRLSTGTQR